MPLWLLVAAMLGGAPALPALADPAPADLAQQVQGDWLTADRGGVIRVSACGDAICGTVVGVSEFGPDGSPPKGANGQPTCGRVIIKVSKAAEDEALHGTVTDPANDSVYTAKLSLGDGGELRLRGYIGTPLLGRTEVWTRANASFGKDCRFSLK